MRNDILAGLNATNKHDFQVTQNNDSDNNNDIIRSTKNAATTNNNTIILLVPTVAKNDAIIMNDIRNVGNSNIKNEMTSDLKQLEFENKTINLFNITYNYGVSGCSLHSFEKLIPILLECGTIIIVSSATSCDKVKNFILKISKTSLTAASIAGSVEFPNHYRNNLGKAVICSTQSIDADPLNKLDVCKKQYSFDNCGKFGSLSGKQLEFDEENQIITWNNNTENGTKV